MERILLVKFSVLRKVIVPATTIAFLSYAKAASTDGSAGRVGRERGKYLHPQHLVVVTWPETLYLPVPTTN